MDQEFEWSPTDLHDIQKKHGDLPPQPTHDQVAQWYDASLQTIRQSKTPEVPNVIKEIPKPQPIAVSSIARGTALAVGAISGIAIAVSVVMSVINAIIAFITANAMVIGGGFSAVVFVWVLFEGKRASKIQSPNVYEGGNITVENHTHININPQ